ncbi:MAG: hypothetical protein ACKOWJ_06255 [Micrococcales bacterium]
MQEGVFDNQVQGLCLPDWLHQRLKAMLLKKPLLVVISAVVLALAGGSVIAQADPSLSDQHIYFGGGTPGAKKQAWFWAENAAASTPFSANPWDASLTPWMAAHAKEDFPTVLALCVAPSDLGCISDISYSLDAGSTWQKPVQELSPGQRSFIDGHWTGSAWEYLFTSNYLADASKGLFQSVSPNYFALPGADNSIGNHYFINAVVHSAVAAGSKKAVMQGIDLLVQAGKATEPGFKQTFCDDPDKTFIEASKPQTQNTPNGYCFEAVNIPSNVRFRMSVNLGTRLSELSGWFDGRLGNPSIDFGTAKAGVISVEGDPVSVDYAQTKSIDSSSKLYDVTPEIEKLQGDYGTRGVLEPRNGMATFTKTSSIIPLKAAATNTVWRIQSWKQQVGISKCKSNPGVQGIVLTNAMTYSPTPPTLNALTGDMSFQVASAHQNPDGTLNKGEYRLLLQQGLVKCIWGSKLTGSASISVTDNNGASEVATTSLGTSNGWTQFYAVNFHYSKATIKVRLNTKK